MYKIQDIYIKPYIGNEILTHMYYRGNNHIYADQEGGNVLRGAGRWDFFTYFNSLSLEKWKKYTYAKSFYLVFDIKGKFELNIFGHYFNKEHIEREGIGNYFYKCPERTKIVVPLHNNLKSQVVAFELVHEKSVVVYDAYYAVDVEEKNITTPYIALTTTTFKKEEYIENNISILKEELFKRKD